jgi:hypothetical protein
MNGHPAGQRAAWVLAAATLAISSAMGSGAPVSAPNPEGASAAHVTAGSAVVDPGVLVDQNLGLDSTLAAAAPPLSPSAALAADAFVWPSSGPTVQTTTTTVAAPAQPAVWWKKYVGTNHVWMPTLGLSKAVYSFPCSRSRDPDNYVYRWGCAGANNVYLLGHNYGVFYPLYKAYNNGTLKKGMPVIYADGKGHTRLYRVTTWRVVSPLDSGWAIASQPVPSMTLQTCVGPNGSLRLNVRLVAVDK